MHSVNLLADKTQAYVQNDIFMAAAVPFFFRARLARYIGIYIVPMYE